MVELGCEIGNHSWDHQDMLNLSIEDVVKEFGDTDQALIDACGQDSTVIMETAMTKLFRQLANLSFCGLLTVWTGNIWMQIWITMAL